MMDLGSVHAAAGSAFPGMTTRALAASSAADSADDADIARINDIGTVALVATVIGQLTFGWLADRLGRRILFVCTMLCIAAGCVCAATLSHTPAGSGALLDMTTKLLMCMAIMGVGVGGEYPLSAAVSSEGAAVAPATKVRSLATVFACQGVGHTLAAAVAFMALGTSVPLDSVWRLCIGIGALLPIATLYPRYKLIEDAAHVPAAHGDNRRDAGARAVRAHGEPVTDVVGSPVPGPDRELRDTREECDEEGSPLVARSAAAAPAPRANGTRSVWSYIVSNRMTLLGTAGNWFLLDVVFYANGLFASQVMRIAGISTSGDDVRATLLSEARGSLILALIALPGYIAGRFTATRVRRKRMQLWGFIAMAVLYMALFTSAPTLQEHKARFFLLYGLSFMVANWGPNMTTYVIPAEVFPKEAKATCHGISAASGKLGAAFGAALMPMLLSSSGAATAADPGVSALQNTMLLCGFICLSGAAWTHFFTPDDTEIAANAPPARLSS